MESALEMGDGDPRIPRLAAGWEGRGSSLSPAEGFLLSRVDGRTSWMLLREIGGLPPDEVDRCLERWLAEGLLEVVEAAPSRPAAGSDTSAGDGVDASLDLTVELQREILEFDARLDRPYYELLGLKRDADDKAIKRAYFGLSKKFHPDRYFRKRIGHFHGRLERVFKKLVEAYELLSDPSTRAEVERSLAQAAPPQPAAQPTRPEAASAPPSKPSKRETLERLRRMFRIPEEILAERKLRARQFYEASRVAAAQQRWLEAAASTRLAIAFDPWEPDYKKGFAEVQSRVHELRAGELLKEANASLDGHAQQEALRLYEEVLHYRPGDADVNHQAAVLALELGEFEKAREYAETACEVEPEVCARHVTLSRVLRRSGLLDRARGALKAAERIDRNDAEVQKERRALERAKGRN